MKSIDTNGDGRIDYEELTTALYNRRKILNESNLRIAFEMLDKN